MSNKLSKIIIVLCVIVFCYSAFQLISAFWNYHTASEEYSEISETYLQIENTASIDESEELTAEYTIDFEALKSQNEDCVGWIVLPESKINYPIVRSKDNTEYISLTFEGKNARSGAIFMDMNCEPDFSSVNTVIYGHNMKDGSMFRALNNLTEEEYYNSHQIFVIYTGSEFEYFEIISCYPITTETEDCWKISFDSDEEYESWLETVCRRSVYDAADYRIDRKTITLSTCRGTTGGSGRFIVHLQKKED